MPYRDAGRQCSGRVRVHGIGALGSVFVVVASAVFVSCGGDDKPSAGQQIATALRATTSGGGLEVAITVNAPDDSFTAVEHIDLKTGRSSLSIDDGDVMVAPGANGLVFVDSVSVREETGGRWLLLSPDEVKQMSANMHPKYGDLTGLILKGGLTFNWLTALAAPGNTTLIGREVVQGEATSHFLAEPVVDAVSSPVEAWVSDGGLIVQIHYLTANDVGEAVDVTASIEVDGTAGTREYPTVALAVTRDQLDKEAQAETDRLAAAEAAEKDRLAAAEAAAAEAAKHPVPAGDVTADDVGIALNRLAAAGIRDSEYFAIPELEQICLGIFDMLEHSSTMTVSCERLLSAPLRDLLCPVVARFASAVSIPASRTEIAAITTEMAAVLDGESEMGLVSHWFSETPDTEVSSAPLEGTDSKMVDLPIRDRLQNFDAFWREATEYGTGFFSDIMVDFFAVTCDMALPVDWDILNEPPPHAAAPTPPIGAPAPPWSVPPIVDEYVGLRAEGIRGEQGFADCPVLLPLGLKGGFGDGGEGSPGEVTMSWVTDSGSEIGIVGYSPASQTPEWLGLIGGAQGDATVYSDGSTTALWSSAGKPVVVAVPAGGNCGWAFLPDEESREFSLSLTGALRRVERPELPPVGSGIAICARVDIDNAALRSAPGISSPLLGRIPPGDCSVTLITAETINAGGVEWYNVMWDGLVGWTATSNMK